MNPGRLALVFLLAACVVGSSSCNRIARYRTLPPSIHSVYVPLAVNRSAEPQIEEQLTQFIQEEILADGRLDLVHKSEADAILGVEIRSFSRQPWNFDSDHIATNMRTLISADVTIRQNIPGRPLLGGVRPVSGFTTWDVDVRRTTFIPEPLANERALRDFARAVVRELITGKYRDDEEATPANVPASSSSEY